MVVNLHGRVGLVGAAFVLSWILCNAVMAAKPVLHPVIDATFEHHVPCNLFDADEAVKFSIALRSKSDYVGQAIAKVIDYWGDVVWHTPITLELVANQDDQFTLEIGPLVPGYYELSLSLADDAPNPWPAGIDDSGEDKRLLDKLCFGIGHFVDRRVDDIRQGDYRFGMKMWYRGRYLHYGDKRLDFDERQVMAACAKLGLSWTRAPINQTRELPTTELANDFPVAVVLKVDGFPVDCWDDQRYGPYEAWTKKNGKYGTRRTIPKKEPFQRWLVELIKPIDPAQNVYEIWNEPWSKMSPEDFAVVCNYATEAILSIRPDAIIGPNLLGSTSRYQYDAKFIEAGGMKGVRMVALHPYSVHIRHDGRQWLRDYQAWINAHANESIELHVTEFGKHSTPEGPDAVSEREQAQSVLQQTLVLYAEGIRSLIPHTMGELGRNPTYREDWFGFFRIPHQPKPVLMAYANAAHLIDGSQYLGDLWYGPGIAAMVFERDGTHTLALWVREGLPGKQAVIQLGAEVTQIDVVDMVGRKATRNVSQGELSIDVTQDITYVVGISAEIARQATRELNPQRWPAPETMARNRRSMKQVAHTLAFDGDLASWKNLTQLAIINPKVNGYDASGFAYLGWDDSYLYAAVDMRDNQMMNTKLRNKLYREDCVELFISTEPRDSETGYGPNDHQLFISPTSAEGQGVLGKVVDQAEVEVRDIADSQFYAGATKIGWLVQVAIPWAALNDFDAKPGAQLAMELRVNDADTSHPRFKLDLSDAQGFSHMNPAAWSLMELE